MNAILAFEALSYAAYQSWATVMPSYFAIGIMSPQCQALERGPE
jgi:hypothetical protein